MFLLFLLDPISNQFLNGSPWEQNCLADFHSRINNTNNWSINNESFNIISNKYGPYSADRFTNNLNKKVNKFNSHVNAFTDDWSRY